MLDARGALSVAVWACLLVYRTTAELYDEPLAGELDSDLDVNYINTGPLLPQPEAPTKVLLLQFMQTPGSDQDKILQIQYNNKWNTADDQSNQTHDSDLFSIMKRVAIRGTIAKNSPKVFRPFIKAPRKWQTKKGKPLEDGYILKLFNIPGNKSAPVLLIHGILDSADSFLLRGRTSLVVYLGKYGYDVWVASVRGVKYSRRHVTLDPDLDSKFWDYSFHEIGYYDLPAVIDFILNKNGVKQLSAAGHSQGNTIFYVLGATRPEYNDKIKIMIALGPISYLNHYKPPVSYIIDFGPSIDKVLTAFNQEEVFGDNSIYRLEIDKICTSYEVGYDICGGLFFSLAGYDVEEFEPEMFNVVIGHFPTSTSKKNAKHLLQIATIGDFVYYDYGREKNLKLYNSHNPPPYNLSAVTMKVALFVGRNDRITPIENVRRLNEVLPNVVQFKIMEHKKFNHMDYLWGRHMYQYLFPHMIETLNKFS